MSGNYNNQGQAPVAQTPILSTTGVDFVAPSVTQNGKQIAAHTKIKLSNAKARVFAEAILAEVNQGKSVHLKLFTGPDRFNAGKISGYFTMFAFVAGQRNGQANYTQPNAQFVPAQAAPAVAYTAAPVQQFQPAGFPPQQAAPAQAPSAFPGQGFQGNVPNTLNGRLG